MVHRAAALPEIGQHRGIIVRGMNAYDLLEDEFESPLLKGALGLDAVLGTNFGPRAPGTVLTLLYRLAAESAAGPMPLALPRGGLGAHAFHRRAARRRP